MGSRKPNAGIPNERAVNRIKHIQYYKTLFATQRIDISFSVVPPGGYRSYTDWMDHGSLLVGKRFFSDIRDICESLKDGGIETVTTEEFQALLDEYQMRTL